MRTVPDAEGLPLVKLEKIPYGEVFIPMNVIQTYSQSRWGEHLYVKTKQVLNGNLLCINLADGNVMGYGSDVEVAAVDAVVSWKVKR